MKANAWIRIALVGLVGAGALSACSATNDGSEDLVGNASLAITAVPSDVGCIRLTVTGARTVVTSVPVMTGQSSTFSLSGLPLGNDSFSGEGFGGACPPAAGAVANWIGAPVAATVAVSPPVNVTIKMVRNGQSNVGVDFQDDATSCSNMLKDGSETDIDCGGPTCPHCASGKACVASSDCTTASCVGGVCSGCNTNADCPGGTCDPILRQCVGGCAAPKLICAGACVDVTSNPANCGGCGVTCPAGLSCTNGMCSTVCPAGQVRCGSTCSTLQSDPVNCGACGHTCLPSQACQAAICVNTAPSCMDGVRDGGETGVDCGGSTGCSRCAVGQNCMVSSDCTSMHCLVGLCSP